ncbi:MAG: hypothetical protein ACXVII_44480 [Solirubrobacteraceae bacterium]
MLILARNLVTNLALPALLSDAEERVMFFNEAADLIFGLSFEEVGWAGRCDCLGLVGGAQHLGVMGLDNQ